MSKPLRPEIHKHNATELHVKKELKMSRQE